MLTLGMLRSQEPVMLLFHPSDVSGMVQVLFSLLTLMYPTRIIALGEKITFFHSRRNSPSWKYINIEHFARAWAFGCLKILTII